MESDDEFDMLPVKRRGASVTKVNNGLDTNQHGNYLDFVNIPANPPLGLNGNDDDDGLLPVKRRGATMANNTLGNDPFNNLPKTKLPESGNDSDPKCRDVLSTNGNNGLHSNHFDNPPSAMFSNDSNQFGDSPPIKRRAAPHKASNGIDDPFDNLSMNVRTGGTKKLTNVDLEMKQLDNSYQQSGTDSFAKHRGEPEKLNKLGDDPFDNISIKVRGGGSPKIPIDSKGITQPEINSNEASNGLSTVLQNEMMYNPLVNEFDRMGLIDMGKKIYNISSVDHFPNDSSNDCVDQNNDFLASQQSASRKPKGVSFDLEKVNQVNSNLTTKHDFPSSDMDLGIRSTSNGCIGKQQFGDNFDEMFQSIQSSDFIDGLDFLEQCGGNDTTDAMEQLQRKSLYVRFDPLCENQGVVKQSKSIGNGANSINKPVATDINPVREVSLLDNFSSTLLAENFSNQTLLLNSFDDPFSPVKHHGTSKADDDLKELYPTTKPDLNNTGLVEPLLYTQSDMDEVIKKAKCALDDDVGAREMDWQKKYEELECKIKEEIAMRELIEQDHREKIDCLRKDNIDMKQVLSQYEKTIVELTENSHHDNKSNEETLAETIRAKEQLQEDLNSAEQNLFDAYKRIEKLKQTIDAYKRNEDTLKENSTELTSKLQKSEDRYMKLREHVTEKIDGANALISKVRKQQEVDLAGLQAALKKAQNRVNNLELEIQQKNLENQQLSQICDDLIKKVSGE